MCRFAIKYRTTLDGRNELDVMDLYPAQFSHHLWLTLLDTSLHLLFLMYVGGREFMITAIHSIEIYTRPHVLASYPKRDRNE